MSLLVLIAYEENSFTRIFSPSQGPKKPFQVHSVAVSHKVDFSRLQATKVVGIRRHPIVLQELVIPTQDSSIDSDSDSDNSDSEAESEFDYRLAQKK
jgi:hypothetical protein